MTLFSDINPDDPYTITTQNYILQYKKKKKTFNKNKQDITHHTGSMPHCNTGRTKQRYLTNLLYY